jgi:hypothetical protein
VVSDLALSSNLTRLCHIFLDLVVIVAVGIIVVGKRVDSGDCRGRELRASEPRQGTGNAIQRSSPLRSLREGGLPFDAEITSRVVMDLVFRSR